LSAGALLGKIDDGTALKDSYLGLMLAGGHIAQETYEGNNALGGEGTKKKNTPPTYELAIDKRKEWQKLDYIEPYLRGVEMTPGAAKILTKKGILNSLSLDPADAQALKPKFKMLAICRLKYPFIGKGFAYIKPTFDNPREIYHTYKYL